MAKCSLMMSRNACNNKFGEIGDLTKFRRKDLDLRQRAKEGGIRKAANLTKAAIFTFIVTITLGRSLES